MNIYFTGYMGSGKTSLGRELAQQLDIPFYDLDDCIVERYGQSVAHIFASEGEAAFRQKESVVLYSLPASANAIISLGGGTFCFPNNRDWIQNQGISVYLKVSPDILYERLAGTGETRPIIKANNSSKAALLTFIETHLASRQQDYELADIIYEANGEIEDMVTELAGYFWRFLKG